MAAAEVKGAVLARQGFAPTFSNDFTEMSPGVWISSSAFLTPAKDVPRSDTLLFNQGYATMVPIDANYTARAEVFEGLRPFLTGVRPWIEPIGNGEGALSALVTSDAGDAGLELIAREAAARLGDRRWAIVALQVNHRLT